MKEPKVMTVGVPMAIAREFSAYCMVHGLGVGNVLVIAIGEFLEREYKRERGLKLKVAYIAKNTKRISYKKGTTK